MSDPVLTATAVAFATKAAEGLAEGGKAAFAALAKLVRRRFGDRDKVPEFLLLAESEPADRLCRFALVEALGRAAADDPAFAQEVRRLCQDIQAGPTAEADGRCSTA